MSAAALKSLVDEGPLLSDRLDRALALCDSWFDADPHLAPYVIRSVLGDAAAAGLNDPQGVDVNDYAAFEHDVLPHLRTVLDLLIAGQTDQVTSALDALVVGLRDFLGPRPLVTSPSATP
jgi:hypothetical protein